MGSPLRSFMRKMEWLILGVLAGVDRTLSSLQRTLPPLYGRNIADTGPPAHVAALQILGISGARLSIQARHIKADMRFMSSIFCCIWFGQHHDIWWSRQWWRFYVGLQIGQLPTWVHVFYISSSLNNLLMYWGKGGLLRGGGMATYVAAPTHIVATIYADTRGTYCRPIAYIVGGDNICRYTLSQVFHR